MRPEATYRMRPAAARPSIAKVVVMRAGVVLLGLIVTFSLLEGAYRTYKFLRYGFVDYINLYTVGYFEPHPVYGYALRKRFRSEDIAPEIRNSVYGLAYHMNTRFTTNSLGYRGREFSRKKIPETLRIVTFGGSTTMGIEVNDPDTWPALLERRLQEDAAFLRRYGVQKVEVINAAVGGWRSREGLLRLRDEVRHFEPDLLLLAFNWNDAWRGLHGLSPDAPLQVQRPWWRSIKIVENLSIRYDVYRFSDARYLARLRERLRPTEPWVQGLTSNILAMRAIAAEIGARTVLVDLPGLARLKTTESVEAKLIAERTRLSASNIPFFAEFKDFESALFDAIGRQNGIRVVDVHRHFDEFGGEERVKMFVDEMHMTVSGTRQTAEAIVQALDREATRR